MGKSSKIRLDRGVVRWWLIALGILLAWPSFVSTAVGTALVALGMLIHLWAKGCLQPQGPLTVCGPYRWTRNPLHMADFLIDVGLCLVINCLWLAIPYLLVWLLVNRQHILSLEHSLADICGQAWTNYKANVPAFFPYKRPYRDVPAEQGFSWSNPNLLQGREIPHLIRTASYPLVLLVAAHVGPRMWIHLHNAGEPWTEGFAWLGTFVGMVSLAGIGALQGFAWILGKQLHDRRAVLPAALHKQPLQLGLMLLYLLVLTVSTLGFEVPGRTTATIGITLLLLGFGAIRYRRKTPSLLWDAIAWCTMLGGAGLLAGLPWAMILAVAVALAIRIDAHIGVAGPLASSNLGNLLAQQQPATRPLWDRLGVSTYYTLFSLAVVAISLGKASFR